MGRICEHTFETEDPKHPGYSLVEYDLYARLGLTIRKNLKDGYYEIVTIRRPREVLYASSRLEIIVNRANQLEEAENTWIECGSRCPRRRH